MTRLPRGTLSRDAIVVAALAVIERGGAPALTIRAVARELGADPTALYRHFRDKADLIRDVGDRLLADISAPRADATWREALEELAWEIRTALTRNGGVAELFVEMPYTPAATRLVEGTLAHLTAAGLPPAVAGEAFRATIALVFGQVATLAEGFWSELVDAARPAASFPAIHAGAAGWTEEPDAQFRRQLALLLDGVERSMVRPAANTSEGAT